MQISFKNQHFSFTRICSTKNTEKSYKKKGFNKSKEMHKGERIIKQSGLERRDRLSEIKSGTFRISGYGMRQGYGKGKEEEERKGIIRAGYITNHI